MEGIRKFLGLATTTVPENSRIACGCVTSLQVFMAFSVLLSYKRKKNSHIRKKKEEEIARGQTRKEVGRKEPEGTEAARQRRAGSDLPSDVNVFHTLR